jgi:predicted nuclease of predicted toxin-antitoxin system
MSKFLVDAQLPRRLARFMQSKNIDVVHTLDLPEANKTKDGAINRVSLEQERIVITKDEDFVQSFTLQKRPYKLLLITTGNISNRDLLTLFDNRLEKLMELFEEYNFVEMTRGFLIIHA